jgi:hypothetical protein
MTQSAFVHAPSSSRNLNLPVHITPNWGVSWELGIIFGVLYILLVGTWRRLGLFGLLSFRLDGNPGKSYVRQSYVPPQPRPRTFSSRNLNLHITPNCQLELAIGGFRGS